MAIDDLFDAFAEAVVGVFGQQLFVAGRVAAVDPHRALPGVVFVAARAVVLGAARGVVAQRLLGVAGGAQVHQAVALARFGVGVVLDDPVARHVGVLLLRAVAEVIVGVAVVAQAGVGPGEAAPGVVGVVLQHAVEVDGLDAALGVVGVAQLQLALVADLPQTAPGVVASCLAQAVGVGEAGFAVAGVLIDLAHQGDCAEAEQAAAGDGAQLAFGLAFGVVVVVEALGVGQGLVAQAARVVVGVAGGEALAVDLAGVFDEAARAVVGEGLAALSIVDLAQAAAPRVVAEAGGGLRGALFDQAVGGVVDVVGGEAVGAGLGDEVAGRIVLVAGEAGVGVAAADEVAEVVFAQTRGVVARIGETDGLAGGVVLEAGDAALGLGDGEQLAQAVVGQVGAVAARPFDGLQALAVVVVAGLAVSVLAGVEAALGVAQALLAANELWVLRWTPRHPASYVPNLK